MIDDAAVGVPLQPSLPCQPEPNLLPRGALEFYSPPKDSNKELSNLNLAGFVQGWCALGPLVRRSARNSS
ncbi:hypothetical protein evm_010752 [Chilo suppressalis]|nr:hypothetical protein evm_010752 [Chilo suppressalis]